MKNLIQILVGSGLVLASILLTPIVVNIIVNIKVTDVNFVNTYTILTEVISGFLLIIGMIILGKSLVDLFSNKE